MRFFQTISAALITALLTAPGSAAPIDDVVANLDSSGVEYTITPVTAAEHSLNKRWDFPFGTFASFIWFFDVNGGLGIKVDMTAYGSAPKGRAFQDAKMSTHLSGIQVLMGSCQLTSNGGVIGPWHRAGTSSQSNLAVSPEFNDNVRYCWCGQ